MPTNITIKNIPDLLYERIRSSSAANRRSINAEIIFQLEEKLMSSRSTPSLAEIRSLRSLTQRHHLTEVEINQIKSEGRP